MRILIFVLDFVVMFISGFSIYRKEVTKYFIKPIKYYIEIIAISFIFAYLVTILSSKNVANIIVYFICLVFLPYIKIANESKKYNEQIFMDIIHYCSYMSVQLRQSPNVSYAIEKCCSNMKSPFANDLLQIANCFDEDKIAAKEKMDELCSKYNYSIIKKLNIIILQFQYDDKRSCEMILDVFQDDIDRLSKDVKDNQKKRKMLKVQYIGLTIGSMLAMFLLTKQLTASLGINHVTSIDNLILGYYVLTIIALFLVELYFNNNITKE